MATGAHSISLVTHGTTTKTLNARVVDFMWIIEKLVRIHD